MRSTSSTAELLPTGHSTMHLYPIDGTTSRVAPGETAFRYRDGMGQRHRRRRPGPATHASPSGPGLLEGAHPTSAGGAYVDFLMDEGQDRVKACPPRLL